MSTETRVTTVNSVALRIELPIQGLMDKYLIVYAFDCWTEKSTLVNLWYLPLCWTHSTPALPVLKAS